MEQAVGIVAPAQLGKAGEGFGSEAFGEAVRAEGEIGLAGVTAGAIGASASSIWRTQAMLAASCAGSSHSA